MSTSVGLRTLVLNSDGMPVSVFPNLYTIPAEDAISRALNGSCVVVKEYDRRILTPSRDDLFWPSVIMNMNQFKYSEEIRLRANTLYYRDHGKCQYCGSDLTIHGVTFDHVVPRFLGGKHEWKNVVAACHSCNLRKGHKEPKGEWKPRTQPWEPNFFDLLKIRRNFPIVVDDDGWMDFLDRDKWSGEVILSDRIKKLMSGIDNFANME